MKKINYFFEKTPDIKRKLPTKKWIEECVKKENKKIIKIDFIFCSDAFLKKINNKHLNHNTFTDVISLDYSTQGHIVGDVFISVDRVTDNAQKFQTTFKEEIARVMIHGVLHLVGYKDELLSEKKIMRDKENNYLERNNT